MKTYDIRNKLGISIGKSTERAKKAVAENVTHRSCIDCCGSHFFHVAVATGDEERKVED